LDLEQQQDLLILCREHREADPQQFVVRRCVRVEGWDGPIEASDVGDCELTASEAIELVTHGGEEVGPKGGLRPSACRQLSDDTCERLGHQVLRVGRVRTQRSRVLRGLGAVTAVELGDGILCTVAGAAEYLAVWHQVGPRGRRSETAVTGHSGLLDKGHANNE
jgi:hypothetical protein